MNVRNISLTPRMEEVREPFIIAPIQFELDQIKGHFDESLDSIKKQFLVAEELMDSGKEDEGKNIYRSQVVFLEGILDFYLHEMSKYCLYKMFTGEWGKSAQYKKLMIPIMDVEKALDAPEYKTWFFQYLNQRFSRDVMLSVESMRDQLNLIGISWAAVLTAAYPADSQSDSIKRGKDIIQRLFDRRNVIAHQNDRSHESAVQNHITRKYVEECFYNVECLVIAIHTIASEKG